MNTENIKAIVVGRHSGEIPGVDIVEQVNQLWSVEANECAEQLAALIVRANDASAALLFQNVPGVLAVALYRYGVTSAEQFFAPKTPKMGVIISVPGQRTADVPLTERLYAVTEMMADTVGSVKRLVMHANGRAKIKVESETWWDDVTVTVDPVTPFVFSHIAWF